MQIKKCILISALWVNFSLQVRAWLSEPLWLPVCVEPLAARGFKLRSNFLQLCAQTCWDLQKATESLCFVSPLQHTGRQIDLLQSFHSSSNYMKLLVYYRLSEYPAGFIKGAFRRCERSLGKGARLCTSKWFLLPRRFILKVSVKPSVTC